jgi:2-octaprenyl-6-methoxyphenol hydroxylase
MNAGDLPQRCDVAIVGGGMVGASLALALGRTRQKVVLIEAVPADSAGQPSFDDRTTGLGNGARRVLETLGVWERIATQAAPIREIHVSDAGHFGFARLCAADQELSAFGYTVRNRDLGAALWAGLGQHAGIEVRSPARVTGIEFAVDSTQLRVQDATGTPSTLQAQLLVAADGAHSIVKRAAGIESRTSDYQQVAVVANLRAERAADGCAYERFTASGPQALLPLHDGGYTLIWTVARERAQALLECAEPQFLQALQRSFGWRAGKFQHLGRRSSYPLSLVRAEASTARRVALVGNAAQSLHPVAAQGFNLGLRDAAVLAELIAVASDPGDAALLAEYARRRAQDRRGMILFTDQLVRLFGSRRAGAAPLRNLGLLLFDLSPTAKRALSRLSWGFGGALPRLARGLPLVS